MGLASSGRPSREAEHLLVRIGSYWYPVPGTVLYRYQVQYCTVLYQYRSFFFTHVRHFTPHTQQRQRQMLWSRTRSALGTSHCAPGESITYVLLCIEHMSYGITALSKAQTSTLLSSEALTTRRWSKRHVRTKSSWPRMQR